MTRRKRPPVKAVPARGRRISLPDEVHDRLWLLARQRRTTVSAVATEILDKSLPRYLSRARAIDASVRIPDEIAALIWRAAS